MRLGMVLGPTIVIALGVGLLLNNFGLGIPVGEIISVGWPFILIVVGLLHIVGVFAGRGSLPGGLIVLTVGVLFAFDRLLGVSFGHTWPVLLIAAGGIGLMRAFLGPVVFMGRASRRFRGGFVR